MKRRRRQGATLGLVAVCVLVIIVVGIGCFFLAKIFGGGREVANATDAGALNIAKNAMKKNDALTGVDAASYPNFIACSDPPNTKITLLTYNRCVAQALLVAMNAQAETAQGATAANGNAQAVLTELTNLGSALTGKLQDNAMTTYFDRVNNDTRMFSQAGITSNASSYKTAFMKTNESTNVYFTPTELAGLTLPANWASIGTDRKPPMPLSTGYNTYIRGYANLSVPGVGNIMGVPVFPQQNPHLVAKTDFDAALGSPAASIPPNAFSCASSATEQKSGALGGAVAAAIVGAIKLQSGGGPIPNYDFPAAVPGGYLELVNLPGTLNGIPANGRAYDNEDNIFNQELGVTGSGINIATGGGAAFYSTDTQGPNANGAVGAWAAYNASTGTDSNNRDATLYPPTLGYSIANMKRTTSYTAAGTAPTLAQLLTIGNNAEQCLQELNGAGLVNNCLAYLPSMEQTYYPAPSGISPADPSRIYSNVDVVKARVIAAFQSGAQSVDVQAPVGPSGLGVYPNGLGPNSTIPSPYFPNPIQTTGTIDALLTQVTIGSRNTACTKANILANMTQRCYEIKPDAAASDIAALWQRQLPIGQTLYIYLPGSNPSAQLTISSTPPSTRVNTTTADGFNAGSGIKVAAGATDCENDYPLDSTMVNVPIGNLPSDDNLHDRPWRNRNGIAGIAPNPGGAFYAQDRAKFVLSSGFQNLLGSLEFSNQTQGAEHFSRPN